ncbi:MAG: glycosyltransferase family 4 protein [Saprospiraceae bacterium]|nr:glycosyltransferase family 4 protein [Saprospiraceae bacterium]
MKKKTKKRTHFFEYANVNVIQPQTKFGNYWRTYGIKKNLLDAGIDIYHGLSHEIPVNLNKQKIKSVVTIHDLIFKHYPQQFPLLDRLLYDAKFKYACQNADAIVAISEHTKQDIIQFYNIDPQKITVIYQTCHDRFKRPMEEAELDAVAQEFHLPSEFMLYVGSIIPRKKSRRYY